MTQRGEDYRRILKQELVRRIDEKSSYSLRSFARDLNVSPSLLSEVLNSKRRLTLEKAQTIIPCLGLPSIESQVFRLSVEVEREVDPLKKTIGIEDLKALKGQKHQSDELNLDTFRFLSRWYYLPILQIIGEFPESNRSKERVASALGLSSREAGQALENLLRLGLAERKGDYYFRLSPPFNVSSKDANFELVRFYDEMLQKARQALRNQIPPQRYFASETISLSKSSLPHLGRLIDQFADQVKKLAELESSEKEVFTVQIQSFQITNPSKGINHETRF